MQRAQWPRRGHPGGAAQPFGSFSKCLFGAGSGGCTVDGSHPA